MNRDLIIAVIVSVLLHAGLAFGGHLFKSAAHAPADDGEIPTVELTPIPPIEPEPEEVVEITEAAGSDAPDIAPPMQDDVPAAVVDSLFVQQIQPPPPPGIARSSQAITIPTRPPGGGRGGGIGQGMGNVFDLSSLDQKPVIIVNASPLYPYEMKRAGISGEVRVSFVVDPQGNVHNTRVVSSSHREFETEALKAVMRMRFKPGRRGGAAVATKMELPIQFTLKDN